MSAVRELLFPFKTRRDPRAKARLKALRSIEKNRNRQAKWNTSVNDELEILSRSL